MATSRSDKKPAEYFQKIKSNLSTLDLAKITKEMSEAKSYIHEVNGDAGGKTFHYSIYRCPVDETNSQERFYLIDKDVAAIGKGGFGTVHEAYALDITNKDLRKVKQRHRKKQVEEEVMQLAIKILQPKPTSDLKVTEEKIGKEMEIFTHFYKAERPVKLQVTPPIFFIVMEYIPGYELNIIHPHHHTTDQDKFIQNFITNASFGTRIDLIREMAWSLNIFHHNTTLMGDTVIHRDLKGTNFKVLPHESSDGIFFDVSVIDTGSSLSDPDFHDSSVSKHDHYVEGTPLYMSQEAYQGNTGVKSDIYSMTPLFAAILGASNPLKDKENQYAKLNKPSGGKKPDLKEFLPVASVAFNFEGMFEKDLVPPDLHWTIKPITQFLNRMQHQDPTARPSTDENIRFFTILSEACSKTRELALIVRNSHLHFESPIVTAQIHNSIREDKAKIFLLATGLWDTPIGRTYTKQFKVVDVESKFEPDKDGNLIDVTPYQKNRRNEYILDKDHNKIKQTILIEDGQAEQITTFKDYEFSKNLVVCEAIIMLNNHDLLDANLAKRLTEQHTLLPQFILELNAHGQLTSDNLLQLISPRPIFFAEGSLLNLKKLIAKCKNDFEQYSPGTFMEKSKIEARKAWKESIMNKIKQYEHSYNTQSYQYTDAQKILFALKDIRSELESERTKKNASKGNFTKLIDQHIKSLESELIRLTMNGRGFAIQATQMSSTGVIYDSMPKAGDQETLDTDEKSHRAESARKTVAPTRVASSSFLKPNETAKGSANKPPNAPDKSMVSASLNSKK